MFPLLFMEKENVLYAPKPKTLPPTPPPPNHPTAPIPGITKLGLLPLLLASRPLPCSLSPKTTVAESLPWTEQGPAASGPNRGLQRVRGGKGALTQLVHGAAVFLIKGQLHHSTGGLADLWLDGDRGCEPRGRVRALPLWETSSLGLSLPLPPCLFHPAGLLRPQSFSDCMLVPEGSLPGQWASFT